MTNFDYTLLSFLMMVGVSVWNARLAHAGFQAGQRKESWISLALSGLGASAAVFNLTQLASM